jgi:hypothetical protein
MNDTHAEVGQVRKEIPLGKSAFVVFHAAAFLACEKSLLSLLFDFFGLERLLLRIMGVFCIA